MYKRSIGGWAKHWDFILLDTICLQLAFVLSYYYRFHSFTVYSVRSAYRTSGIVLFCLGIMVAIFFNTMHNVLRRGIWEELKNTIVQCGLVFAAIVVLLFTSKDSDHVSRIVLYVTVGLYLVLSFATRLIYKKIVLRHKSSAKNRLMLLVGDKEGITRAINAFKDHPEAGIDVKGVVPLFSTDSGEIHGYPVVATEQNASDYIRTEWVDEVYFAVADPTLMPHKLIKQCDDMAVTIHQQMFTTDELAGRQWVEKIAKQPVLTTSIRIPTPRQMAIKRIIDVVAGLILSLAAGVTMAVCGPMIKKKSPGPLLLKHERIGLNGKKFHMYTLRVMYMDAEKRLSDWKSANPGKKLTVDNDPRFIGNEDGKVGIGAKLRKWSLDDLPKGFNLLIGNMSLVGVRAPSPAEWERYEFRHRARLACKPGITGLWQASGRAKTMSFEEATKLDTEYITNWSLGMDFGILVKTAFMRHTVGRTGTSATTPFSDSRYNKGMDNSVSAAGDAEGNRELRRP